MRPLPLTLLLFLLAVGVYLAFAALSDPGGAAGGDASAVPGSQQPVAQQQGAPAPGEKPQGHVYTCAFFEPQNVNPFTSHDPLARGFVFLYTHETLLDRDPVDGSLRGALAESYELSEDGSACTFTLREGVSFADGSPLTMDDVLFGWQLASAGHLMMGFVSPAYQLVANATALDERRLHVEFADRHYAAVDIVGQAWLVANKQFFVDRVRERLASGEAMPAIASKEFADHMRQIRKRCGPGTGPYVLRHDPEGVDNWQVGQELLLVRNETCWRRKVQQGTWNFAGIRTMFRDQAAAQNALLRGEVDWFMTASADDLDQLLATRPRLAERFRKVVYDHPELGVWRIVWNCRRGPCQDPAVRRALDHAMPRAAIGEVFAGAATPAVAYAKPDSPCYPKIEPTPFDPAVARRMLRAAGHGEQNPLSLRLLVLQGPPYLDRIVALLQDAARRTGFVLDVQTRGSTAWLAEKGRGEWDGMLTLLSFEHWGDPYRLLHGEGQENLGGWQHDDADRLATEARREFDTERRMALWRELHELTHREQPAALLVHPLASMLVSKRIRDLDPGPLGLRPNRAWVPVEFQRR